MKLVFIPAEKNKGFELINEFVHLVPFFLSKGKSMYCFEFTNFMKEQFLLLLFLVCLCVNKVSAQDIFLLKTGPTPARVLAPIGKGTNGNIYTMKVSKNNMKLFVGGSFTSIDSTTIANSIAYLLELGGNYYWNPLGTGVNGVVNAICEHDNKIFVGGEFPTAGTLPVNNVAFYDGSNWLDEGCIYGVVYDLVEFNGTLYSAGDFDVCTAPSEVNFARWNNGFWQHIMGIDGWVNTMEVVDTNLFLGGKFKYNNVDYNVLKWNENQGFQLFNNAIANEVKDFETFHDTVYAVCKRTSVTDSNLLMKLVNDTWAPCKGTVKEPEFSNIVAPNSSFNTLCVETDTLSVGGKFSFDPSTDNSVVYNCANLVSPSNLLNWFTVNDEVEKMILFKGAFIAVGKFTKGFNYNTCDSIMLHHIGRKTYSHTNAITNINNPEPQFIVYPNPVTSHSITIVNDFNANNVVIVDLLGRTIYSASIEGASQNISLPEFMKGNFIITLFNKEGLRKSQKLVVE